MKPANGQYRLTSPGAPAQTFTVSGNNAVSVQNGVMWDSWTWDAAHDSFMANNHTCSIRCTGESTYVCYVGVEPGFAFVGECERLS